MFTSPWSTCKTLSCCVSVIFGLQIMQGLLDQYTVAGNSKALEMVVGMANYFSDRVKNVIQKYSIERHWTSLNEETGGMNDVLYQLYTITVICQFVRSVASIDAIMCITVATVLPYLSSVLEACLSGVPNSLTWAE